MKRIALAALAVSTMLGTAQAEVDQTSSDLKEAVKAVWQDQQKAFDAHDVDGVLATYADSDDIMLMGTGPGEHWVGPAEIKDAYAHFMETFDPHTLEVKCGDGAGSTKGDVAWVTGVCHFIDKQEEESRQYVANLSAVLVKQGDAWRFHTMHFSHLTGRAEDQSQQTSE